MGDADHPETGRETGEVREMEADRFEFEKQAEHRRTRLEERKLQQARFDTWLRFIGTVALGVLVTGGVQWYGIRADEQAKLRAQSAQRAQKTIEREAQQAQIVIQLTNAREKALSDLRARMFESLLQNYFQLGSEAERIAILQLIGLNFRDAVQIKPMFELLDWQFRNLDLNAEQRSEARKSLRSAARSVIRDQLSQIRQSADGGVCHLELTLNESRSPPCLPKLDVELLALTESTIEVRTNTKDGAFLATTGQDGSPIPPESRRGWDSFTVTYFDMPMVDYTAATSMHGEPIRYSIVLSEAEEQKTARIAVAVLPLSAVNAQRRYAFDELLQEYLFVSEQE